MSPQTETELTIQEAATQTGLSEHTLRYYERIGLISPISRAPNGHRRYHEEDIGADADRPLTSGGVALICEEGRTATETVTVRPVG